MVEKCNINYNYGIIVLTKIFWRYKTMQTMLKRENERYIQLSMLHLGILKWSKASRRLHLALQYAVEHNPDEQHVMDLYTDLAEKQKCSWSVIERSLRYAVQMLWKSDPVKCSKLFYRSSVCFPCPPVSEFLGVYVSAFQRGVIQEWVDYLESQKPY